MKWAVERFGEPFTMRFPMAPPFVMFSDPAAVRDLFTGDPEELRAGESNVLLRTVLGENSLLLLDGARHLRERELMQPPRPQQRAGHRQQVRSVQLDCDSRGKRRSISFAAPSRLSSAATLLLPRVLFVPQRVHCSVATARV
jgi:cytochrome P450